MHRGNAGIADKIGCVEGKNVGNAVHIHRGHKPCVIDLNATHTIRYHEPTPLGMNCGAIRQEGEYALNKPGTMVGLSKGEAETTPCGPRSGTHVPELNQVL